MDQQTLSHVGAVCGFAFLLLVLTGLAMLCFTVGLSNRLWQGANHARL